MTFSRSLLSLAVVLVLFGTGTAQGPLRTGSRVPAFEAIDDAGQPWKSADHVGKKLLLVYFYPSNSSSASRVLAQRYRDQVKNLAGRGIELVAVNGESAAAQRAYKQQNRLNFTLLSDPRGEVAKRFGVSTRGGAPSFRIFAVGRDGKVAAEKTRVTNLSDLDPVLDLLVADFWANRTDKKAVWQPTTPREWRKVLTREQFMVARQAHTERAFANEYWDNKKAGDYRCICCGQVLFKSSEKFRSGTGWPSFWDTASKKALAFAKDTSFGTIRTEVKCSHCDAHLGHVFDDGPAPTGLRYCMNSAAMAFDPGDGETNDPE